MTGRTVDAAGTGGAARRFPGGTALAERAVLALSAHAMNTDTRREAEGEHARRVRDASAVAVIAQAVARGQLGLIALQQQVRVAIPHRLLYDDEQGRHPTAGMMTCLGCASKTRYAHVPAEGPFV